MKKLTLKSKILLILILSISAIMIMSTVFIVLNFGKNKDNTEGYSYIENSYHYDYSSLPELTASNYNSHREFKISSLNTLKILRTLVNESDGVDSSGHDEEYSSTCNFSGKILHLMSNINIGGFWTPIGWYYHKSGFIGIGAQTWDHTFHGTFDGNGYTITGITGFNKADTNSQTFGLFGDVRCADFLNVRISNCNISVNTNIDDFYFGLFAGYDRGATDGVYYATYENCYVNNVNINYSFSASRLTLGLLCGMIENSTLSCKNNIVIDCNVVNIGEDIGYFQCIGGLVGEIIQHGGKENSSLIESCVFIGKLSHRIPNADGTDYGYGLMAGIYGWYDSSNNDNNAEVPVVKNCSTKIYNLAKENRDWEVGGGNDTVYNNYLYNLYDVHGWPEDPESYGDKVVCKNSHVNGNKGDNVAISSWSSFISGVKISYTSEIENLDSYNLFLPKGSEYNKGRPILKRFVEYKVYNVVKSGPGDVNVDHFTIPWPSDSGSNYAGMGTSGELKEIYIDIIKLTITATSDCDYCISSKFAWPTNEDVLNIDFKDKEFDKCTIDFKESSNSSRTSTVKRVVMIGFTLQHIDAFDFSVYPGTTIKCEEKYNSETYQYSYVYTITNGGTCPTCKRALTSGNVVAKITYTPIIGAGESISKYIIDSYDSNGCIKKLNTEYTITETTTISPTFKLKEYDIEIS